MNCKFCGVECLPLPTLMSGQSWDKATQARHGYFSRRHRTSKALEASRIHKEMNDGSGRFSPRKLTKWDEKSKTWVSR